MTKFVNTLMIVSAVLLLDACGTDEPVDVRTQSGDTETDSCGGFCGEGQECIDGTCTEVEAPADDTPNQPDDTDNPETDDCGDRCTEGLVCGEENGEARCVLPTEPVPCNGNCGNGTVCNGGECVVEEQPEPEPNSEPDPPACNNACGAGTECVNNACVPITPCDGVCGSGTVCEDDVCVPVEVDEPEPTPEPEPEPCDGACGSGTECVNDVCVPTIPCDGVCGSGTVCEDDVCVPENDDNPEPDAGPDEEPEPSPEPDPDSVTCDGEALCFDGEEFCVIASPLTQTHEAPVFQGQNSNQELGSLYGDTYARYDAFLVRELPDGGLQTPTESLRFEQTGDGYLCYDFAENNRSSGEYVFTLVSELAKQVTLNPVGSGCVDLFSSGGDDYAVCGYNPSNLATWVWHHSDQVCAGIDPSLAQYCALSADNTGIRFVLDYVDDGVQNPDPEPEPGPEPNDPQWATGDRDGDGILNQDDLLEAADTNNDGAPDALCVRTTIPLPWRAAPAYRQGPSPTSYGNFDQVHFDLEDAATQVPGAPEGVTEWCYSFLGEDPTNFVYRYVSQLRADGITELDEDSQQDCSTWVVPGGYGDFCSQYSDEFCSGFTYPNGCGDVGQTFGIHWDGVSVSGI